MHDREREETQRSFPNASTSSQDKVAVRFLNLNGPRADVVAVMGVAQLAEQLPHVAQEPVQSTGQSSMLQARYSGAGHGAPPTGNWEMSNVRLWLPPPQETSQVPHAAHEPSQLIVVVVVVVDVVVDVVVVVVVVMLQKSPQSTQMLCRLLPSSLT